MNIIKKYGIELRITRHSRQFGCDIANRNGVLLCSVIPEYAHENDAVYAALHGLATQNNFSGCLKEAEMP